MSHIPLKVVIFLGRSSHPCVWVAIVILLTFTGSSCRPGGSSGWDSQGLSAPLPTTVADSPQTPEGKALELFTGGHSRLAWTKMVKGSPDDIFHFKKRHALYVLGSRDSVGSHALVEGPSTFRKPLISPDGNWVVYTETSSMNTYRVPFTGGTPEKLGRGFAMTFWTDPSNGEDWLYVGEDCILTGSNIHAQRVVRRRLWDFQSELIWDAAPVTVDNFTLTTDGKKAVAGFPWPDVGSADLSAKTWTKLDVGCWPTAIPNVDGLSAVFDGAHRNLKLMSLDPPHRWTLPINVHPDLVGSEVYHPMWASHHRFLTFSGPYRNSHDKDHASVFQGGEDIEVYVARLAEDLSSVEDIMPLTNDGSADFSPCLWIQSDGDIPDVAMVLEDKPVWDRRGDLWPLVGDRLLLLWRGFHDDNTVTDLTGGSPLQVSLDRSGTALPGINHQLISCGGIAKTTAGDDVFRALGQLTSGDEGGAIEIAFQHMADTSGTLMRIGEFLEMKVADNTLTIRLGGEDIGAAIPLRDGPPHHLVLNLSADENGVVIVDDEEVATFQSPTPLRGLAFSEDTALQFGDGSWHGSVHRFAIHGRMLSLDEATGNRIAMRDQMQYLQPPARHSCRVRLVELATVPTPESLGAYQDSLTTARYIVVKGSSGIKVGTTIDVAHWAVIDREVTNLVQGMVLGETYDLVVEEFSFHPELSSQRIESFIDPVPLFYDVSWANAPRFK